MPSPDQPFLDAIHDHPDDGGLRLIYADFLDEYGDPRSDLLRKEVQAAEILGRENVHGILDAQAFYGQIEPEILQQLAKAPFPSREVLEECKDHVLVLDPGYSLIENRCHGDCTEAVRKKHCNRHNPIFLAIEVWYFDSRETFARQRHSPQWLLVPKQCFDGLLGRTFSVQQRSIAERYSEYRILRASEIVCALVVREHATGQSLSGHDFLRCSDNISDGSLVHVSLSIPHGVSIYPNNSELTFSGLGIAISREF